MRLRPQHLDPSRTARWGRLGSAALWYAVPGVAIAAVVAYIALAIVRGVNPPVVPVTGHSMQPFLRAGDLVFLRSVDPRTLRRGDVIAFHTTKAMQQKYDVPAEYVHRIVKVSKGPAGYQFQTKGDNVAGPDPFSTFGPDVIGEYDGKLVGAGYPILFFRSRQGIIFGAAVLVVLLLYFVFGFWERRQEALETNAVTMEQIVDEARALRDSMVAAATAARAPPAPSRPSAATRRHAASDYVPVWQQPPGERLAEFELAPAYRTPDAEEPTLEFTPIPSSRALVPYVAPGIDFDRLERELHAAVRSSLDVQTTMHQLVGAIGDYGEHLRSHTEVMQNLAAATGELRDTTTEMRSFLASLTELLTELVRESKG